MIAETKHNEYKNIRWHRWPIVFGSFGSFYQYCTHGYLITNMRKRPSDSLCNLKYIYICIFYSFSKIHYIFLTKHIHQDFLELQKKKTFLFLTFFKIHSIIFYHLQNFDMECFPSAIYHTIFRSSNVGARRSGGEARAGSVSHHCISALIRC